MATARSKVLPEPRVIPIAPVSHLVVNGVPRYVTPPMKAWSFSALGDYERCHFYSYLKRIQKIPEPIRDLPAGKSEHANDRGTRIHDAAEHYVRGTGMMIPELRDFTVELDTLAREFKLGNVVLEGEWGMSKDWEPAPYSKAWLRLKLDSLLFLSQTEAVAIDYKTGRMHGNEYKHAEQVQLYALVTFLRYPKLEVIHTELWYLDHDEITRITYTRSQALRFKFKWNKRGSEMMNAVEFPPNANIFSCKWCMYGPKGSGVCEVGV